LERSALEALADDLVSANQILARQGVVDGFGHASARHPSDGSSFLLARAMAPALVRAADVMTFAHDGSPRNGDERRPTLERFIHGAIYRVRPDVQAVVHSHAPALIAFGVARHVPFRPVYHMASFLAGAVPVFEIRDAIGDGSDLLVCNDALGVALADALGTQSVVLMRGHGATIVGRSVPEAVFRSVYAVINAGAALQALQLTADVSYLSEAEAARATETNAGQIARAWELWKQGEPL